MDSIANHSVVNDDVARSNNASNIDDENASPHMVGTKSWSMSHQSIKHMFGPYYTTYYVLNFYRKAGIPQLGLTNLPPKQFHSQLAKERTPAEKSKNVAALGWDEKDREFWANLICTVDTPLVIHLQRKSENCTKIGIQLSYGDNNSCVYAFNLCPITQDAYLIFFVPYKKFKLEQLKLLSAYHYLEEYSDRQQRVSASSNDDQPQPYCWGGCDRDGAEIVFEPCGHSLFCAKCVKEYKDPTCPTCRHPVVARHKRRSTPSPNNCAICPTEFCCRCMDCMLLPCRCVIGCFEYAQRAIHPEADDCCPSCQKPVRHLLKIFTQS